VTRYKYCEKKERKEIDGEGRLRRGGRSAREGEGERRVSGWALFIDSNEKVAVGA